MDLLIELPLYNELDVVKTSKAFRGYEKSYDNEKIDSKDPSAKLRASKPTIENLLHGLWNEIKGFKYQGKKVSQRKSY